MTLDLSRYLQDLYWSNLVRLQTLKSLGIFFLGYVLTVQEETFESFKEAMESNVKSIAQAYTETFENRCSKASTRCLERSHYGCDGNS